MPTWYVICDVTCYMWYVILWYAIKPQQLDQVPVRVARTAGMVFAMKRKVQSMLRCDFCTYIPFWTHTIAFAAPLTPCRLQMTANCELPILRSGLGRLKAHLNVNACCKKWGCVYVYMRECTPAPTAFPNLEHNYDCCPLPLFVCMRVCVCVCVCLCVCVCD
jgi:hypothetical protein